MEKPQKGVASHSKGVINEVLEVLLKSAYILAYYTTLKCSVFCLLLHWSLYIYFIFSNRKVKIYLSIALKLFEKHMFLSGLMSYKSMQSNEFDYRD